MIDGSPTAYSTMNAILKNSTEIADKLNLRYSMLFECICVVKDYILSSLIISYIIRILNTLLFDILDKCCRKQFVKIIVMISIVSVYLLKGVPLWYLMKLYTLKSSRSGAKMTSSTIALWFVLGSSMSQCRL